MGRLTVITQDKSKLLPINAVWIEKSENTNTIMASNGFKDFAVAEYKSIESADSILNEMLYWLSEEHPPRYTMKADL